MNNRRNHYTRHLIALILTLAGLTSWSMLPICPSNQAAHAASNPNAPGLTGQSAPKAVANGRIAFVSSRDDRYEIFTMNSDGSDRKQLTFEIRGAYSPVWSPDGTKIAFIIRSEIDFKAEIHVMNADGSNQTKLTSSHEDGSPAWSPDGTRIAFARDGICVMNADGSDQRLIARGFAQPAWSPDGSRLAVTNLFNIYSIDVDGRNLTPIIQAQATPSERGPFDMNSNPAWSPDGSKIVFNSYHGCDFDGCRELQIAVANSDGTAPKALTEGPVGSDRDGIPRWSPDGVKIVFARGDDLFVMNADGSGDATNISNTNNDGEWDPSWQAAPLLPFAIDNAQFFVSQHYRDFLSREPDPDGLAFWTNELMSCGGDEQCIEAKRVNVSAAYFLSIEFQQTGYLVYRMYKTAYGNLPDAPVPIRLKEFLPDTQEIGHDVIVNQAGWEQLLENNKQAFAAEFVQRPRFTSAFPATMTAEEFVDKLNNNTGDALSPTEHDHLVSDLTTSAKTRAEVLRAVADSDQLAQREFNRAFVLMQYFGYLRRNPSDAPEATLDYQGYNFWLNKLDSFNGDFIQAEMVKAFITSTEYRQRFGQ